MQSEKQDAGDPVTAVAKARPIIFSAPMVLALLAGTKTQTRRVLKPQPAGGVIHYGRFVGGPPFWTDQEWNSVSLPWWTGDRLWVREGFSRTDTAFAYMADHPGDHRGMGWRPSIHMPRAASRLTLTVTDVRVQRLQKISEEDAQAEGATPCTTFTWQPTHRSGFQRLWTSINGPGAWEANPYVAAIRFTVERRNVDAPTSLTTPE